MKKVVLLLVMGNLMHFAMREIALFAAAHRAHHCKTHVTCSKEQPTWEKVLLFEVNLGEKIFGDDK
jgi:hypothetical protein